LRYFSIAHLANAGAPESELQEYRIGLAKLLNSLSWNREIALPQPIDNNRQILRIDLRDFNWTAETWRTVLALYPYGIEVSGNEIIKRLNGADLPYLRADWFVANASQPPLYHSILGLPNSAQELEQRLGIDVARNLAEERSVARAGIRNSGVSQNNRIVERHLSPFGAYWRSYDFRSNLDDQNIFKDPINPHPAGGEIIFNLPNGMQAYLLVNGQGKRLDVAPIEIVSDRNYPDDPVIKNGRSCMSCHYAGMKSFRDDIRAVLESEHGNIYERDPRRAGLIEKGIAIYPDQETLDRLLDEDTARFRRAVEKAGGSLSENFQTEPINALARKFNAELSIEQAAAETGLAPQEFQARLRGSVRLASLGFAELLQPNGAFKRDNWERHFADIVRDLHLGGVYATNLNSSIQTANNSRDVKGTTAINTTTSSLAAKLNFDHLEAAHGKEKFFIRSMSMFIKPQLLEEALHKLPEFQTQQLLMVDDMESADLIIELDRPIFTYSFTFRILHKKSNVVLISGKVTAIDGSTAAPKIAKQIMKDLTSINN
jgi:hypothetical protein